MPAPIETFHYEGQPDALDTIVGGDRPLVIRGLVNHWPLVKAARESDQSFAAQLMAADNGAPVDALLMPPEAEGVVGYRGEAEAFK